VFNVADSAVVVGAILLFLLQWNEEAGDRRRGGEPQGEGGAGPE
jgi:lipoprotein signal peptidase